jgi:hypothetical protein
LQSHQLLVNAISLGAGLLGDETCTNSPPPPFLSCPLSWHVFCRRICVGGRRGSRPNTSVPSTPPRSSSQRGAWRRPATSTSGHAWPPSPSNLHSAARPLALQSVIYGMPELACFYTRNESHMLSLSDMCCDAWVYVGVCVSSVACDYPPVAAGPSYTTSAPRVLGTALVQLATFLS